MKSSFEYLNLFLELSYEIFRFFNTNKVFETNLWYVIATYNNNLSFRIDKNNITQYTI